MKAKLIAIAVVCVAAFVSNSTTDVLKTVLNK